MTELGKDSMFVSILADSMFVSILAEKANPSSILTSTLLPYSSLPQTEKMRRQLALGLEKNARLGELVMNLQSELGMERRLPDVGPEAIARYQMRQRMMRQQHLQQVGGEAEMPGLMMMSMAGTRAGGGRTAARAASNALLPALPQTLLPTPALVFNPLMTTGGGRGGDDDDALLMMGQADEDNLVAFLAEEEEGDDAAGAAGAEHGGMLILPQMPAGAPVPPSTDLPKLQRQLQENLGTEAVGSTSQCAGSGMGGPVRRTPSGAGVGGGRVLSSELIGDGRILSEIVEGDGVGSSDVLMIHRRQSSASRLLQPQLPPLPPSAAADGSAVRGMPPERSGPSGGSMGLPKGLLSMSIMPR